MVRLDGGMDCDLRIVPQESFGAALQYFTGNKQHNVALRIIALHKGYKLNEYGVYDKNNRQIAGRTEEGVYSKLGLKWIPPELRENKGEIEAEEMTDYRNWLIMTISREICRYIPIGQMVTIQ